MIILVVLNIDYILMYNLFKYLVEFGGIYLDFEKF